MTNQKRHEHFDIFLAYGLSLFVIMLFFIARATHFTLPAYSYISFPIKKNIVIEQSASSLKIDQVLFSSTAFDAVQIEGKAYIVYDLVGQTVIASKNETMELPLASITKVMTAVSSILHASKETPITIKAKEEKEGYDLGLKSKQVWTLSELLKYTLVFSSNDGAEIIANSFGGKNVFIKQMNEDARVLNLNITFTDTAGLDIGGAIGGKGTVLDTAKLFGIARKNIPDILDATTKKRQTVTANSGRISGVPNTNQYIENLPGAEASKTGYTDMAGGNLGVIVDISIGHPVVIVVLGSTKEGRFKDMEILYEALKKSIQATTK